MAAFGGMNYDELKSIVTLTSVDSDGANVRQGIELNSAVVKKLEKGESAAFQGETFRSMDGSVRIRLLDGSGFTSVQTREGTVLLSAPPTPAVETSTGSDIVSFVVLRVRNHRFLASYRAALKKLGFTSNNDAFSYPGVITFEHPSGVARAELNAVFEPLVHTHISKWYAFVRPVQHRSDEWWKYEMWMEYKKEISIWAD